MQGNVLIVDGNRSVLRRVGGALKELGLEVAVVRKGCAASLLTLIMEPDVIVSNLFLKGLGGLALARRLKERQENDQVLFIAISRKDDGRLDGRARDAGFDVFLPGRNWEHLIPEIVRDFLYCKALNESLEREMTPSVQ